MLTLEVVAFLFAGSFEMRFMSSTTLFKSLNSAFITDIIILFVTFASFGVPFGVPLDALAVVCGLFVEIPPSDVHLAQAN